MTDVFAQFGKAITGFKRLEEDNKELLDKNRSLDAVVDGYARDNIRLLDQNIARAREAEEVDQILGKALGIHPDESSEIVQLVLLAEEVSERIAYLQNEVECQDDNIGHLQDKLEKSQRNATRARITSAICVIMVIAHAVIHLVFAWSQ